jgi:AraC-like DNA-binding protein
MESPRLRDLLAAADRLISLEPAEGSPASLVRGLLQKELSQDGADPALVLALSQTLRLYLLTSGRSTIGNDARDGVLGGARTAQLDLDEARAWKAVCLMQEEPSKRWTVSKLAKALGTSRPVFARHFARVAGVSPLRYLIRCRMELAAALLRDANSTLAEVAAAVGYDSEYAFNRAFKRHHHVPPGAFRRTQQTVGAIALAA